MSDTKLFDTTQKHRRMHRDLKAVLIKYKKDLTAMEMLAIASHLVGTLIALQDQTKMTPDQAVALVQQNIHRGNEEAIGGIFDTKGSA